MKATLIVLILFLFALPAAGAPGTKDVETIFSQAQTDYKEGRLDEAAEGFSKAAETLASLKQQDKARAVYNNVAVIRMKQERWQDAYDVYVKAFALPGKPGPEFFIKAVGNMAFCAEKEGRHALKAEAIERLFTAKVKVGQPELLNFLSMQGDAYRACERYALACKSYEKALALKNVPKETRVTLLTGLGLAQGNLGRYPKALSSLTTALKEATDLQQQVAIVEATSNIGIIYWEMGQYGKAKEFLEKALSAARQYELRRNEGIDANNIGLVYKSVGDLNEAIVRIETALAIAREVENVRDEAIALGNRALLFRMRGNNAAARENYALSLDLYRKAGFSEGEASSLMGLAKMDTVVDRDYGAALEKLNSAAAIYEKLENPGFLAEAYVQLGELYQKAATPNRKTRDLVFMDEEPRDIALDPADALKKSGEFYAKALKLAEATGRKEMIWSSLHGLAFIERENNNLQSAMDYYIRAIDVVLSMKGAEESQDLLLEFLHNKDGLFAEAIDVCSKLYEQTKDPRLLLRQMEYDEIYRNEVMRAHMRTASLSYAEPEKKALYEEIIQLGSTKKKAETAARNSAGDSSASAKAENVIAKEETTLAAKEFESKLKLWKSRYPGDAVLFDSVADVNMEDVRAELGPDQGIVQYIPLEDSLIILTATKEEIAMTRVEVPYATLASLIRDDFIAKNIEGFGRGVDEELHYGEMVKIFRQLYDYLYAPVADRLKDKSSLYIVTSKYLSYVPFPALIVEEREAGMPHFLVEDKTITLSRLSFMKTSLGSSKKKQADTGNIIAVGDPAHDMLGGGLGRLEGAAAEAERAINTVKSASPNIQATLMQGEKALESEWRTKVGESSYSIFYFATHGVPYAEIKHDAAKARNFLKKKKSAGRQKFLDFCDANFTNNSHLNGFLLMAHPDDRANGVLTLQEIQELPDTVFKNASLAILSACNTAVSYSPKVVKDATLQEDLESEEAAKELAAAGWTPGVDQVCLVDTFMKKNFRNVYGTLWFADDTASSMIMTSFMENLNGAEPAKALREAQLAYLKNPPEGLGEYPQHPYFWACGNIFGQ